MADDPIIPGMDLPAVEGELVSPRSPQARTTAPQASAAPRAEGPMPPSASEEDAKIYGIEPPPPPKMTLVDEFRAHGATEDQIGAWGAKHRPDWKAAGWSDEKIDAYLTGSKTLNPRRLPQAFMDRARAAQELYDTGADAALAAGVDVQLPRIPGPVARVATGIAEGAAAGWGDEPIGVPEEDMARLRAVRNNGLVTRAADEAIVQAAYSTIQGLFRGINAGISAIGAGAGQVAAELGGGNDSEQARARRDFAQMANIAAILAGSEVHRGAKENIGRAPQSRDFSDAARALKPVSVEIKPWDPSVRATLMKTWDDYGIHPAEVVNDAAQDPTIAAQIAKGQVPDKYTGRTAPPPPPPGAPPPRAKPGEDPYVGVYIRPDGRTLGVMQSMDGDYIVRGIDGETSGLKGKDVDNYLARQQAVRLDRVNQRPPGNTPVPTVQLTPPKPKDRIKVWHGSQHEFMEFDGSKIGTGEGAQAFGHGLYFAENKEVAHSYLPQDREDYRVQTNLKPDTPTDYDVIGPGKISYGKYASREEAIKAAGERNASGKFIYEAEILAHPDEFIDFDKDEQSPFVQEALKRSGLAQQEGSLGEFMGRPVRAAPRWADTAGQARALREAGIKGIRYADEGTRSRADLQERIADLKDRIENVERQPTDPVARDIQVGGDKKRLEALEQQLTRGPTYNYVVFDAKDVNVISRNGEEVVKNWDQISPDGLPTVMYAANKDIVPISDRLPPDMYGGDGSGGGPPPGGLGADNPIGPAGPPPEGPGWRVPGPARAPRPPIFRYDDRSAFVKFARGILDGWKKTFQPELMSDRSLTADPLFARYKSRQAAGHDVAIARGEEYRHFWFDHSEADRVRYMDDFEAGRFKIEVETKPDVFERVVGRGEEAWQQIAQRHSDLLEEAYKMEEEAGSPASYIQDYFPHIFEDPIRARAWVDARASQLGPNWFRKHRAFETIREAQEAGLRLKTTNPEDLVTMRLMASADMIERMDLLNQLHKMGSAEDDIYGLATPAKGLNFPLENHGWIPINAPNGTQWMIHPDIQPLWKNAVEAKGLWANEGAIGSTFRGWMSLKNVWVPLKLAVSLFHPLHVWGINFTEGMVRAADQIWKPVVHAGQPPDVVGAMKSAFDGIYGPVQAMFPETLAHLGKTARDAWKIPETERTPAQKAMMDLFHDGGFVPELSEQLRIDATRKLQEAVQNDRLFGTAFHGLRFIVQELQAPIFQQWIPNLKSAAYLRDAQALLQRRPELLDNVDQRRVALRAISKSIDDRFGEMFYGGMFWNRTLKDAGIGSFISLGWQTGMMRQAGGALLQGPIRTMRRLDRWRRGEAVETPSEYSIRDAQNKFSYVAGYVLLHSIIFGTLGYLMTRGWNSRNPDQPPDDPMPGGTDNSPWGHFLDLTLPRIGGRNPDGSPRRLSTFSYTREVPMWFKHYEEHGGGVEGAMLGTRDMLANKILLGPIKELLNNQNYYGAEIRDPNAPYYDQVWQLIKNFGGEQAPISWTGYQRSIQTGGNKWEAGLSFLGLSPAPAYASKTAVQNRISYFFDNYVAAKTRPYGQGQRAKELGDLRTQLLQAQQRGDQEAMSEGVAAWAKAGGSMQGLTNILHGIGGDVAQFRALPLELQEQVMKEAGPAEFNRYAPFMKSNIIKDTAIRMMDRQRALNNGDQAEYDRLTEESNQAIAKAAAEGHITDKRAFDRGVKTWMQTYQQPELGSLMTLPKKLRGKYFNPAQQFGPAGPGPQINMQRPTSPLPTPAGEIPAPTLGMRG